MTTFSRQSFAYRLKATAMRQSFSESVILLPLSSEFYQIMIENERVYLIFRYLVIKNPSQYMCEEMAAGG